MSDTNNETNAKESFFVSSFEISLFVLMTQAGSEVHRRAGSIAQKSGKSVYLRTGLDE